MKIIVFLIILTGVSATGGFLWWMFHQRAEAPWLGDRYDAVEDIFADRAIYYWIGESAPSETWLLAGLNYQNIHLAWGMLRRQSDGAMFKLKWGDSLDLAVQIAPDEPFSLVAPWWIEEHEQPYWTKEPLAGNVQATCGDYEDIDEHGIPGKIRLSSPLLGSSPVIFSLFAKQTKKCGTDYIPYEMPEGAQQWRNALPLHFARRRISFASRDYQPLTQMIQDYERLFLGPHTLQSLAQRLGQDEAFMYENSDCSMEVRMCLYEVSPRSVTLLAFEMWQRDHLNYSVDVHTIGFVYDPKEGWCVRESFEPPNIGQLTPVRVGECADNGLEDPDLPPTAWLPGNIGLWNPYQQAAGAFGVVVARFKDQSQGAPQRPIPGGLAPSDQESADNE